VPDQESLYHPLVGSRSFPTPGFAQHFRIDGKSYPAPNLSHDKNENTTASIEMTGRGVRDNPWRDAPR
jgi:hypothetical protein